MGRLLLNADAVAVRIELRHAVTARIADPVAEHSRLGIFLRRPDRLFQHRRKADAMEDVVAEHEAGAVVTDEFLADDEGLRKAVRRRLFRIVETDAVILPVPEQPLESRQVPGGGDDQDIPDPCLHEDGNRIVNHRFVVNREQLFADALRNGVKPRAGAAGENNAFHWRTIEKR